MSSVALVETTTPDRPAPRRLRRVSVARETTNHVVANVIPKGYLRPASQAQWRTVARDVLGGMMVRKDWYHTLTAVAVKLMWCADWNTLTTKPTWARLIKHCQETTGHGSRSAIKRAIRTLIELKLIARVAHGRQGIHAPIDRNKNPQGNPNLTPNEAAVYVLLIPSTLQQAEPNTEPAVERNGPPPNLAESKTLPAHARAHARVISNTKAEPLRGTDTIKAAHTPPQPVPTHRQAPAWPANATTKRNHERLAAAEQLQNELFVLRQISTRDVRSCLRPFFLAGWTIKDIIWALDHKPDGTTWHHDGATGIRGIRGYLRHRLAAWTVDNTPRTSPTQTLETARTHEAALHRLRVEQDTQHAQHATPPTPTWHTMRNHLRHHRHATDPNCPQCQQTPNPEHDTGTTPRTPPPAWYTMRKHLKHTLNHQTDPNCPQCQTPPQPRQETKHDGC